MLLSEADGWMSDRESDSDTDAEGNTSSKKKSKKLTKTKKANKGTIECYLLTPFCKIINNQIIETVYFIMYFN